MENLTPTTHNNISIYNQNINFFNIDMTYTLQFAPGSFINIVWKSAIFTGDENIQYNYLKHLGRTISSPQNNSLSLKIIYYLDYLNFKKKNKT